MSAMNPILAELDGLSPSAKAALQQAHGAATTQAAGNPMAGTMAPQLGALHQPQAPAAPETVSMTVPPISSGPTVPPIGPSPQPRVVGPKPGQVIGTPAAPGSIQGDKDERTRLMGTGSGISQIKNPFLHGLAEVGNTIGGIVAPGLMRAIPGTEEHHQLLLARNSNQLGQDIGNAEKEAQTSATQQEVPLRQAQTQHEQAETTALENPQPKAKEEHWTVSPEYTGPNGEPVEVEQNSGQMRLAGANVPSIKRVEKTTPPKELTADNDLKNQILAASEAGDTAKVKVLQQRLKDLNPQAEQRFTFQVGEAGKKESKSSDANVEKEYTYHRNKWDKDLQTYNAQFEKLQEAQSMVGKGAMGDAIGTIKSLSGLASGAGSGVRITQAELNSIAGARGVGGDFDAWLQKFGTGAKITPQQEQQLKAVLSDVQNLANRKTKVVNQVLDDLANATTTQDIRRIDSQARHALMGGAQ